jgi:hypothetical protein
MEYWVYLHFLGKSTYSLTLWRFSWLWTVLCFCCSTSCFIVSYECCLFLDKLLFNHKRFYLCCLFCLLLNSVCQILCSFWSLWCLVSLSDFVICVLVVLVISLGYIHNLLKMVFLLWFRFVCYCMQTVPLTTVVLSCSGFYWHSVSSTFLPSGSFVCSAHLSVDDMLLTSYDLSWVLLWVFLKTCLWTACLLVINFFDSPWLLINSCSMVYINTGAVVVFLNEMNMVYLVSLSTIVNILSNFTPHAGFFDVGNFVMKFMVTDSMTHSMCSVVLLCHISYLSESCFCNMNCIWWCTQWFDP